MASIFIGFYGYPVNVKQKDLIHVISKGFECWDLSKVSFDDFVKKIKKRIPPINDNVLRNYIASLDTDWGINEEQFKKCSWGLLLPDKTDQGNSYTQILGVLNLYSTAFLRPAFYVTNFAIFPVNKKANGTWLHTQDKSHIFKSQNFISFYKKALPMGEYFQWYRENVLLWKEEDWRFYFSASFYDGLKEYEIGKSIYTWQAESADISTLFETLLTAGDSKNEEIGYRLRKRLFVLIGWKFPSIEENVKTLYTDRSDFVHGNLYKKIIKSMKKNESNDPAMPVSPAFKQLYESKEQARFSLIAYWYLHFIKDNKKNKTFKKYKNVQEVLESGILDTKLREKIVAAVKPIIELLPQSATGNF
ncbi:MAG: hypothetical protein V4664_00875 [Patescibacteria group bacterium]